MILLKINLLSCAVWLFFGLLALVIVAHFLAEFRRKRFTQDCCYLKLAIENSKPDVDSYNAILAQFDELDCYSDADFYKRLKLRHKFNTKFAEIIEMIEE